MHSSQYTTVSYWSNLLYCFPEEQREISKGQYWKILYKNVFEEERNNVKEIGVNSHSKTINFEKHGQYSYIY